MARLRWLRGGDGLAPCGSGSSRDNPGAGPIAAEAAPTEKPCPTRVRFARMGRLRKTRSPTKTRSEERVLGVTENAGSDQLFQFRQDLEQVAHQAVVGHLEDRRFLVL